jgi:hypothetical protein
MRCYRPILSLSLLALTVLGACANPRAESAASAQQSLIGLPKSVLIQCAGAPAQSATADGVEVMTYTSTKLRADLTHFGGPFGGGYARSRFWGPGWGGGFYEGGTESRSCSASFTIKDGKVAKVLYGSADSDGASRLDQCYAVVENCLPPLEK